MRLIYVVLGFFFVFSPLSLQSSLTGGDFEVYADSFSLVSDDGTTSGGDFSLLGSGGEVAGGIVQQPAMGLIDVNVNGLLLDSGENFVISDGLRSRTFFFENAGGLGNAILVGDQIQVDTGGGANADTMAARIAEAVNSSLSGIEILATAGGDRVILENTLGVAVGNVAITETVVNPDFTVSGMSGGGTWVLRAGFPAMERSTLSFSVSDDSVSLGSMSLSTVASTSIVLTMSTDSAAGYQVDVSEDHDLRTADLIIFDDVVDGAVTAGREEYGITTSGDDGQYNGISMAITPVGDTVAQHVGAADSRQVTVNFQAAIGSQSRAGNYAHNVVFTMTANP